MRECRSLQEVQCKGGFRIVTASRLKSRRMARESARDRGTVRGPGYNLQFKKDKCEPHHHRNWLRLLEHRMASGPR